MERSELVRALQARLIPPTSSFEAESPAFQGSSPAPRYKEHALRPMEPTAAVTRHLGAPPPAPQGLRPVPPSSALPPSAAPTRSFSSAPRKAKYRCNTPLRAHEFDLRPELLARRDASKVPCTQSQGAQILRSAQSLQTLISQPRTQDARSQEQSRIISETSAASAKKSYPAVLKPGPFRAT